MNSSELKEPGWVELARAEELSLGLHLRTVGTTRVVLAVIDGELSAYSPICPHAGGPLHLAETEGTQIICPLHGWRFDLRQGGCETHGYRPLRMYDLRVQHGVVYVRLPDDSPRPDATEDRAAV